MKPTTSYMFDAIKETNGDVAATLAMLARTCPAGHRCILAKVKSRVSFAGLRLEFQKTGLIKVVELDQVAA